MNIEELEAKAKEVENQLNEIKRERTFEEKKKKGFKLPWKQRRLLKRSKKPDKVLVFYLSQKYEVTLRLESIVSGNLVVINNKVHVLNPKRMWRYGKWPVYIIREIDRKPVSNLDYDKVKARRDDTEADVPLIKAVLGAVQKKETPEKRNMTIAIIIIVIVAVGAYFLLSGGGGA